MSDITINQKLFDKFTTMDDLLAAIAEQIKTTNKLLKAGGIGDSSIVIPDFNIITPSEQVAKIEELSGILIDMGYVLYQGQRYRIEYHVMPYVSFAIPKSKTLYTIKDITVPNNEAYWVVDFSATTEDTNGALVSVGFNTSRGSILTDMSACQFGPAPLGSTGNVQFDTLSKFPTLVRESEHIIVKASNSHGAAITFGYTFHFIILTKDYLR